MCESEAKFIDDAIRPSAYPALYCKAAWQHMPREHKLMFSVANIYLHFSNETNSLLNQHSEPSAPPTMPSSDDLPTIIRQLESLTTSSSSSNPKSSASLLTKAKLALLHQNALVPTPTTPAHLLNHAQHILELGALISIRAKAPEAFTRYFQQLQPFYNDPSTQKQSRGGGASGRGQQQQQYQSQRSKITGLYLLLLLSQGDYAGFHTLLEGLEVAAAQEGGEGEAGKRLEEDEFVQYPIRLESWLTEGSYDRVWEEMKSERVPSEEFAIFSEVSYATVSESLTAFLVKNELNRGNEADIQGTQILVGTIRSEVASCSEKAYGSIPVANAKNLLFLDSEGSVVGFSNDRGWQAKDGRVHFPTAAAAGTGEDDVLGISGQIIENTLGYARELETIV